MNTSDMHPFIHPLSAAVDPAWESKVTGKSTKASRGNSPKSAWDIWGKKPTWSRCLFSTTPPPNWRSRWM
ncbi:hypothetical protein DMH27_07510 [Raoultella planticola]|nr:hypothetical protein [Raoultella planticola]